MIVDICDEDDNRLGWSIENFMKMLEVAIAKVPLEHRENARFVLDTDWGDAALSIRYNDESLQP